jgi:hypothetical protein
MKIIDGATFTISANEHITVQIQKASAPFQASVSDLTGPIVWRTKPNVSGLVCSADFTGPSVSGSLVSFTVDCDFLPEADGSFIPNDRYIVTIRGRVGEQTRTETLFPPPLQSRSYLFKVS